MVLKGIGIVEDRTGPSESPGKANSSVYVSNEGFVADEASLRCGPAGAYVELASFDQSGDSSPCSFLGLSLVQGVSFSQDFEVVHDGHDLAVVVELECGVLVEYVEQLVHQLNQLHLEAFVDFVPFKIPVGVGENVDVEYVFRRRRWKVGSPLVLSRHGPWPLWSIDYYCTIPTSCGQGGRRGGSKISHGRMEFHQGMSSGER